MSTEIETLLAKAGLRPRELVWETDNGMIPNHAISCWTGNGRLIIENVFTGMNTMVYRLRGVDDFATEELAKKAAWNLHVARIATMLEILSA